ncbi:MAG: hypothetical protein Q4P84_04315 [Elusimicrobiales bacterium]|nr:hypothetical protein [Elusimicrobiales bacterium]
MEKFKIFSIMFIVTLLSVCLSSCSDDEEKGYSDEDYINILAGTSWKLESSIEYTYDNKQISLTEFSDNPIYVTFSKNNNEKGYYDLYLDNKSLEYTSVCYWTIGQGYINGTAFYYCGEIINISEYVLQIKISDGDTYYIRTLSRVTEPAHNFESDNDDNNNTGNSSTSYEKPSVGFHNFTATKTRLKVEYKIYNNDEARVTSAKIYYGTTSNPTKSVTATVSSALIIGNISGLKAGTTYYVKCVATGKGGTTTTTTTKCITNY